MTVTSTVWHGSCSLFRRCVSLLPFYKYKSYAYELVYEQWKMKYVLEERTVSFVFKKSTKMGLPPVVLSLIFAAQDKLWKQKKSGASPPHLSPS